MPLKSWFASCFFSPFFYTPFPFNRSVVPEPFIHPTRMILSIVYDLDVIFNMRLILCQAVFVFLSEVAVYFYMAGNNKQ